jgi:hypothetical protein
MVESDNGEYVNVGNVLPANPNNQMVVTVPDIPKWVTDKIKESLEYKECSENFGGDPAPDYSQEQREPGIDEEELPPPVDDDLDQPW